ELGTWGRDRCPYRRQACAAAGFAGAAGGGHGYVRGVSADIGRCHPAPSQRSFPWDEGTGGVLAGGWQLAALSSQFSVLSSQFSVLSSQFSVLSSQFSVLRIAAMLGYSSRVWCCTFH